jgi:pimeloyl-ACP methyl ester carboxylesterase
MRVLFVHGACVVDVAWWWQWMEAPLAEQGARTAAVALPSCGPATGDGPLGDLYDDIAAVRAASAGEEPTVLVAHSYGGMVVSAAAAGLANVRHLVYLASMLPEADQALAELVDPDAPRWLEPADQHALRLRRDLTEDDIRAHFLHDCPPELVAGALTRTGRQSASVFGQPPSHAAWRELRSTSVVCADDRATPPGTQRRWAAHADTVVELASGHYPFLSRPAELATIVASADTRAGDKR